jgi:hypothetical protein
MKSNGVVVQTEGQYISKNKIAIELPEFNLPTGLNDVTVDVCFNGQQFSDSNKQFKYLAFAKDLPEKDRQKIEDDLLKGLKKKK